MANLYERVIDKAGEFIADKIFLKPSIYRSKAERTEKEIQKVLAARERRKREMQFVQTSDGKMKVTKPKLK